MYIYIILLPHILDKFLYNIYIYIIILVLEDINVSISYTISRGVRIRRNFIPWVRIFINFVCVENVILIYFLNIMHII